MEAMTTDTYHSFLLAPIYPAKLNLLNEFTFAGWFRRASLRTGVHFFFMIKHLKGIVTLRHELRTVGKPVETRKRWEYKLEIGRSCAMMI
jgi:hypothetical protein